jgi:hypothetical protein
VVDGCAGEELDVGEEGVPEVSNGVSLAFGRVQKGVCEDLPVAGDAACFGVVRDNGRGALEGVVCGDCDDLVSLGLDSWAADGISGENGGHDLLVVGEDGAEVGVHVGIIESEDRSFVVIVSSQCRDTRNVAGESVGLAGRAVVRVVVSDVREVEHQVLFSIF